MTGTQDTASRNTQFTRFRTTGMAVALILALTSVSLVVAPEPAEAHHGLFSRWQESRDSGSCCVDVRAVTRCSTDCGWIQSNVKHLGSWVLSTCDTRPADNCGTHRGFYRSFSYPVTVETGHFYLAGTHSGGDPSYTQTYS